MKHTAIHPKATCRRNVPLSQREVLSVSIFYDVRDQLDVMSLEQAFSWVADRSARTYGLRLYEGGVRDLHYRGKRQRSRR